MSATIGDRYPERSIFQFFIAATSGPRFLLVGLFYLFAKSSSSSLQPKILLIAGVLRTLTCGGWTYITSTDNHDWHDVFMILYLLLTIPWAILGIKLSTPKSKALKYRKLFAGFFFGSIFPLIFFFIQHKVKQKPGAYSIYAFFEWSLVLFDVAFDSATVFDFQKFQIKLVDVNGVSDTTRYSSKNTESEPKISRKNNKYFSYFALFTSTLNFFIFWSVLTSLPLLIWYFPLWNMGISGYEAALVSIVSPLLLFVPFFRNFCAFSPQIPQLLTTVGVAAFWALKPEWRLELVAFGAAFACISLANQFWGISIKPFAGLYRSTAFSLGLILSSISKYAFYTNNPIWPIMHADNGGWNKTGVLIAIVASIFTNRPQFTQTQQKSIAGPKESAVLSAFGIGGLFFALHTLLSDSSTIITWVWEGYPVRGPQPVPHGSITIAFMCLGVYLGITKFQFAGSWYAFAASNFGALLMYSCSGWVGYAGGMILTVYLLAVTPALLESAGRHNPAISFGFGFVFLVVLYLAHVWTVAYAFVPGGFLLRERTDLVLLFQQLFIGLGVYSHSKIRISSHSIGTTSMNLLKSITKQVGTALIVLLIITGSVSFKRFHRDAPVPYNSEAHVLTAGIWTVHFGLDNDMWASEGRMRDVIQELEIDVIGFLESDTQRAIMGHRDLTQQIADELGYYADFGPGPNKHTWGCCLLSKFPILNSTHHLLPSPVGELAPAIHATLDVFGELVDIVVFHSGQEEDVEDRRLQSLGVADIMASSSRPMVLLSYLVTKPLEGNYNTYVSDVSGMNDIDPSDWDRWCEYILYKNIKRTGYARVSRSTITDTEIQVGKFLIGDHSISTNNRINEEDVPEALRFPQLFKGEGVRGHRYHVFDEPRYFE